MLRTQYVTLLVEFDDEQYTDPAQWDWSDLADTPVIVHAFSPSESE